MYRNEDRIVVHADVDLEDLIPGFLENQHRDALKIMELVELEEYGDIQRMGHSMKGSGGGYGFDEITAIGMRIETAAGTHDAAVISRQVEVLLDYLSRVEVVYE